MVGLDCSIIMNPKVWEASGHVGGFSDPMVDCRECKGRFRADQLTVVGLHRSRNDAEARRATGRVVVFSGLGRARGRRPTPTRRRSTSCNGRAARAELARARMSQALDREVSDEPIAECPVRPVDEAGHPDRAPLVQPDVRDARRGRRRRGEQGLPPPRDRPGDLRQLQERRRHRPRQDPVRHRADRQELPQRDQPAQLHLPLARVRADGDRVLLPSRARRRSGTSTGATPGSSGTSTSACGATGSGSATTTRTSWRSTRRPRPTSSTASRSASASWRGSRTGATTT